MIFATVGTQLPFDRLIRALDAWAHRNPEVEVFAQVGISDYEPQHMRWARTIPEKQFRDYIGRCRAIVAHAGMGTIITGFEHARPVIVMPRRAEFGEHRNDHQLATAERLGHLRGLDVVHDDDGLARALHGALSAANDTGENAGFAAFAGPELVARIRDFAGLERC